MRSLMTYLSWICPNKEVIIAMRDVLHLICLAQMS